MKTDVYTYTDTDSIREKEEHNSRKRETANTQGGASVTTIPNQKQHDQLLLSDDWTKQRANINSTRKYAHTNTMASSVTDSSVVYERRIERLHKYHWPAIQLNLWMLFMLVASSAILGIFANFVQIQGQLGLGVPW